jgi:hypothetical protein
MWKEILMARATRNGVVLAETDNPVLLEGNGSQDQAKAGN